VTIDDDSADPFAALTELFSKPIKNAKRHRRYDLTFDRGQPVWTLSEIDRMLDEVFEEEMFGPTPED
jgi:hypothetical protein